MRLSKTTRSTGPSPANFLIIGEAVNRLSPVFQAKHPTIPWKRMSGMRNKLIHEYDRINWELVWRTATIEIPILQSAVGGPEPS